MEDIQIVDFSKVRKKNKLSDMQAIDFTPKKSGNQDKTDVQKLSEQGFEDLKSQKISKQTDLYTYDVLLARAFEMLRANNPELGEKKKLMMKGPQLVKMGARRIAWVNFADTCEKLNRLPEHLGAFVLTELGAEGSIDEGKLILKGRQVTNKDIESLLLKYAVEYVTCNACKSSETELVRDNSTRLYFLKCKSCKVDSKSVAPIRIGFHAINRGDRQRAAAS